MSAPVVTDFDAGMPSVARRNWIALGTIARREVSRILRIWTQTLVPPAITQTLYFLIFGGLIGSRVGTMDGITYMDFIVPGLVMMSVIQNSYGNISSSFFGAKFGRHVEELARDRGEDVAVTAAATTATARAFFNL
jgi:ABC-2 type transport system permease protein